ncbi:hypothetical protein ACOSQ4_006801 [Xanthoceras sorbifolium]
MKGKTQKKAAGVLPHQSRKTSAKAPFHTSPSLSSNEDAPPSNPQSVALTTQTPPSNVELEVPTGSSAETHSLESEVGADSSVGKRKSRGKAKGTIISHDLEYNLFKDVRLFVKIITPQVVRQISIIFFQCLTGPWITFTEYPEEEFEILFARFKEAQFTYTCSEDELKDAFYRVVKNGYSKWMFQLRLPVFKKYVSVEDHMAHYPDNIPPLVWNKMVRKWMKKEWQDKSKRNKDNSKTVDMYHTTCSIPMAKYKSEEMDKTGKEPSPIECFKNFHVRKHSNEVWTHEKTKQLYEQMEASKTNAIKVGCEVDEWNIYRETVGKPSHAKEIYGSSNDESSKHARVDKQEELELKIKSLTEELQELRGLVSSMISNSDTQRPHATV